MKRLANTECKWMRAAVIAAWVLSVNLLTSCNQARDGLIMAGSTSVAPYAEILAEDFMRLHPGTNIDVQGGGSAAGITAAEAGIADIGMSSRSLKNEEQALWSVEIAKDGLAVIVNPQNPVGDLSLEQIRDIYAGTITNWKEVGGPDHKIHLIAREEGSGTRSAFESLVMGETWITAKAIVQDSNGAVRLLVGDDPNSIGFISLGLVNPAVKALKLGGVAATRENVVNGSYGLFRPFLFVSQSEPTGLIKEFVDFVLSREGQQILANEGLIPVIEGI